MPNEEIALMAHLMRRAGFGATREELEARVAKGYEQTVEELESERAERTARANATRAQNKKAAQKQRGKTRRNKRRGKAQRSYSDSEDDGDPSGDWKPT